MNKIEKVLLPALESLNESKVLEYKLKEPLINQEDGSIDLIINGKKIELIFEVKSQLREFQLPKIKERAKNLNYNFVIVVDQLFPKIKEELRNSNINYIESNGNIWLKSLNTFIWIELNKKHKINKEKPNRAFTKTGLKVIFNFLNDEHLVNYPYRIISNISGVSLGNINFIIKGLIDTGHLVKQNQRDYKLINKKELLNKWIIGYETQLKPNLFIGSFRFIDSNEFRNWKKIKFIKNDTVWGSEAAADIKSNYLIASELCIYTNETKSELMRNYKLIPDDNGNVKIYKKFWNNYEDSKLTPELLIYTDLIISGNPRNKEIADKIKADVIKDKI